MAMTVQEVIDKLNTIEDKTKEVVVDNPYQDDIFEIDEIEDFDCDVTVWYKKKVYEED